MRDKEDIAYFGGSQAQERGWGEVLAGVIYEEIEVDRLLFDALDADERYR